MTDTTARLLRNQPTPSRPVGITKNGTYVFLCTDETEQQRLRARAAETGYKVAFIAAFSDPFMESIARLGGLAHFLPAGTDSVAALATDKDRRLTLKTKKP